MHDIYYQCEGRQHFLKYICYYYYIVLFAGILKKSKKKNSHELHMGNKNAYFTKSSNLYFSSIILEHIAFAFCVYSLMLLLF